MDTRKLTPAESIPMTRAEAIAQLVAQDVAKWGERERAASQRQHAGRSYGLAMNELANRAELAGSPNAELRAAADKALTETDWRELRTGG